VRERKRVGVSVCVRERVCESDLGQLLVLMELLLLLLGVLLLLLLRRVLL